MSFQLDLGSLCLSCPSTGLDLALTTNASISTLSQSCSFNTPSVTNIESGHLWIAPTANVKVHVIINWPNSMSAQQTITSKQCLITALRHAAVSLYHSHSESIQVISLATLFADILLAVEPIEPSVVTYHQAFTIPVHLLSSTILDSRPSSCHSHESTCSSPGKRCALQSPEASRRLTPLDPA